MGDNKPQVSRGRSGVLVQDFREATMGKLSYPMMFKYEIHLQR